MEQQKLDFSVASVSVEGFESVFVESHDSQDLLTVPEASSSLGIPQSTLYRQLKAGKFQSVRGRDNRLRVKLSRENQIPLAEKSQIEPLAFSPPPVAASVDVAKLVEKLEAANYRVGYLESKVESQRELLESQQEQLRLLTVTPSSSSIGPWKRFWTWLFGVR